MALRGEEMRYESDRCTVFLLVLPQVEFKWSGENVKYFTPGFCRISYYKGKNIILYGVALKILRMPETTESKGDFFCSEINPPGGY